MSGPSSGSTSGGPTTASRTPSTRSAYFATLTNDGAHGGPFRYRSVLTDVLGWVVEKAGGARLHDLIARELWAPMGAEFDAEITVDAHGNAMADGGMCATLRDLARFGDLYRPGAGLGLVSEPRLADTIRGAADGVQAFVDSPDNTVTPPPGAHYRNCWWIRDPATPFFHASGIYGQNIFLHGPSEVTVAKFSDLADPAEPDVAAAHHRRRTRAGGSARGANLIGRRFGV